MAYSPSRPRWQDDPNPADGGSPFSFPAVISSEKDMCPKTALSASALGFPPEPQGDENHSFFLLGSGAL